MWKAATTSEPEGKVNNYPLTLTHPKLRFRPQETVDGCKNMLPVTSDLETGQRALTTELQELC